MEDFSTRTYGTSGLDNRPVFGETSAKVSADGTPGLRVCACVSVCLSVCPASLPCLPEPRQVPFARPLKALGGRKSRFFGPGSPSRCFAPLLRSSFGAGLAKKSLEGCGWRKVQKIPGRWGPFSGVAPLPEEGGEGVCTPP